MPRDWAGELGLEGVAILEKTPDGILVRPRKGAPPRSWQEIFATKLTPGVAAPLDLSDLSGDDYVP